jgi:hypothetical protein
MCGILSLAKADAKSQRRTLLQAGTQSIRKTAK